MYSWLTHIRTGTWCSHFLLFALLHIHLYVLTLNILHHFILTTLIALFVIGMIVETTIFVVRVAFDVVRFRSWLSSQSILITVSTSLVAPFSLHLHHLVRVRPLISSILILGSLTAQSIISVVVGVVLDFGGAIVWTLFDRLRIILMTSRFVSVMMRNILKLRTILTGLVLVELTIVVLDIESILLTFKLIRGSWLG